MKTLTDKYTCYFCGVKEPLINLTNNKKFRRLIEIHHIVEKNQNGTNDDSNLVPVCSNCHSKIHLGLINPKKWIFTTSGWKLIWVDHNNVEHYGKPKKL